MRLLVFLVLFSSCYFLSCSGVMRLHKVSCREICSASNAECCRNCENRYQYYDEERIWDHTREEINREREWLDPSAGIGCFSEKSHCLQACEAYYQRCLSECANTKSFPEGKSP